MRCYVSKNWKFKLESDTVDRPYILARSFWSRINPEWLMPCWEPQPMRPACWCREESCSGPGAPWPARRCLPEQPSLCRWSLFLQHSSPLSCCPAFSFPLNCTQNSVLHSAIKSFLGKSLSAQKSVGKGHSLTRKNIKEKASASMYLYVWTVFPWLFLVLYLFFVFVDVWAASVSDYEDCTWTFISLFWFEKAACHHVLLWQSETLDLVTSAKNASVKVRGSQYKPAFFANRKAGRSWGVFTASVRSGRS